MGWVVAIFVSIPLAIILYTPKYGGRFERRQVMDKKTREALGEAGHAVGTEASRALRKRRSVPTWALLAILAVFLFSIKFPDPGSYYYKREQVSAVSAEEGQPAVPSNPVRPAEMTGGPIQGIDVSMWQGAIDWQAVANSGIEFVIIKATEGTTYVDPCFVANWDGAKQAGLLVSAYHMLWPKLSASTQAKHFLDTMGERQPDFPLALDVEKRQGVGNIGATVETVLLALAAGDGRKPIVYTAKSVWGDLVGWAPGWHEYPLWVADYDAAAPAMPTGWDAYTFWQHSSTGAVPGISGNVDLNTFIGGPSDLCGLGF